MKISDILSAYRRADLNRLARDKVANYVGLPIDILRDELSKVLVTYDHVKRTIQFRKPPGYTILDIMIEHENYCVPIQEIKELVKTEISNVIQEAKSGKSLKEDKQYDLYAEMLKTAWDYQDDLLPAEVNLLNALREYLKITPDEHRLLEAHLPVFEFDEISFNREIEYLAREGIIFTHETSYVVPEETAGRIKEVWGIELDPEPYRRLLGYMTNRQLYSALAELGLHKGGNQDTKINRVLEKVVKPSDLLDTLSVSDLVAITRKSKCPRKYKKDEIIPTLISHIKRGEDIKIEQKIDIVLQEPRIVTEEVYREAISKFSGIQLNTVLEKKKLARWGAKTKKIDRIVSSRFSLKTILGALSVSDLVKLSKKSYGLTPRGGKPQIIERIIQHFESYQPRPSKATSKELFSIYEELSKQSPNAYRDIGITDKSVSSSTVTADFERATKYIFESIFGLTVKTQTPGREEPDGVIKEDNVIIYECKTILSPPYEPSVAHRDQFRRYIKDQYDRLEPHAKTALKCFILIAHSFGDKAYEKLSQMKLEPYVPFCLMTASDLKFIAEKWLNERQGDTLPSSALIFQGRFTRNKMRARFG